jgi:hypothetical protein
MSLGELASIAIVCAAIAATGIALAWVVGRSEMRRRSSAAADHRPSASVDEPADSPGNRARRAHGQGAEG